MSTPLIINNRQYLHTIYIVINKNRKIGLYPFDTVSYPNSITICRHLGEVVVPESPLVNGAVGEL